MGNFMDFEPGGKYFEKEDPYKNDTYGIWNIEYENGGGYLLTRTYSYWVGYSGEIDEIKDQVTRSNSFNDLLNLIDIYYVSPHFIP